MKGDYQRFLKFGRLRKLLDEQPTEEELPALADPHGHLDRCVPVTMVAVQQEFSGTRRQLGEAPGRWRVPPPSR